MNEQQARERAEQVAISKASRIQDYNFRRAAEQIAYETYLTAWRDAQ